MRIHAAAPPAVDPAGFPRILGEFHLRGVLGQGGSGTVYDAEWRHRGVALKVLREELVPTTRARERFLDEARLLRAVDHPGVVKVLGAGTLPGGRPYIVMERLVGEGLARRLDRDPLPPAQAMACFEQLASAVSALHARGLVHRDIKPENVILTDAHAVLLDLGIARPEAAPPSTLSQQGSLRGTPAYMAPERFFGAPASVATDVYELAVLLYMMVTGRLPWTDPTDPSMRLDLPRPSALGCPLPAAFETELLIALSTRAEARPRSVAELAARLRSALARRGAESPRDTAELPSAPRAHDAVAPRVDTTPGEPPRSRRARTARVGAGAATALMLAAAGAALVHRVDASAPVLAATVVVDPPPPARVPPPATVDPPDLAPTPSPPPTARRVELSPAVRALLELHPGDAPILVSGSPAQLRASALVANILAAPEVEALRTALRRHGADCPADPLAGVEAFVIGLGVADDLALDLTARVDLSRADVEACLAGLVRSGASPVEIGRHGAVTSLTSGADTLWAGWHDPRTLVASIRPAIDAAWVQARLAGQGSVRDRAAMTALLERVDTDATLWMIAAPGGAGGSLVPEVAPPLGLYASVSLTRALELRAGLRYATPADAAQSATHMRQELDALRLDPFAMLLLREARFDVADDEVIFTLTMDDATAALTVRALGEMAR